jgi:hypothetical protein
VDAVHHFRETYSFDTILTMIIDIPTAGEFHAAGLKQVHLAWQIAMDSVHDYDGATYYKLADETPEEAVEEFWQRSQPALANAYSLIQQGMELALKGRIAAVSPYLLIGGPKDWPKGTATGPVSFGEFRTLDATDLIPVHNSVVASPLDEPFKTFWEQVRRDRNKIMHSSAPGTFTPEQVVKTLLTAIEALFSEVPWAQRLIELEDESKFASLGFVDNARNHVLRQIATAIRHLKPAEAKRFFGYDDDRRGYVCPHCYFASNRDWQDDWPRLAQLTTKSPGATELYCLVCEETTVTERAPCGQTECKGDVIAEGICLTCTHSQDECFDVASGLVDSTLSKADHCYDFVFGYGTAGAGGYFAGDQQTLANDADAKEHGRFAMREKHLQRWNTVSIMHVQRRNFPDLTDADRVLGHWSRNGDNLDWIDGVRADRPDMGGLSE